MFLKKRNFFCVLIKLQTRSWKYQQKVWKKLQRNILFIIIIIVIIIIIIIITINNITTLLISNSYLQVIIIIIIIIIIIMIIMMIMMMMLIIRLSLFMGMYGQQINSYQKQVRLRNSFSLLEDLLFCRHGINKGSFYP